MGALALAETLEGRREKEKERARERHSGCVVHVALGIRALGALIHSI